MRSPTRLPPGLRPLRACVRLLPALLACLGPPALAADPYPVEVVGTTPLPGVGLEVEQIPAPVQSANGSAIQRSNAADLPGFLNRFLGSVYVNDVAGNPFQPDVTYRGFTASPLLGTPQGLSVYLDGVRLNQPFGDVVSWDLVPATAIRSIVLQPGSNPLYGLNTLGGALSIETRDGRNSPGVSALASYGQYGRGNVQISAGGAWDNGSDAFITANLFRDDGWRDDSPSRIAQVFAKAGWRDAHGAVSLLASYADNDLSGNGLQEQRFLARDYASVYTRPDNTTNQALLLNLLGRRAVADDVVLSGNVFWRRIRTSTRNGDLNEASLDQDVYQPTAPEQAALAAAGYTGFPTSGESAANTPFPSWRCIANALLNDAPGTMCNALHTRADSTQTQGGAAGQATFTRPVGGRPNQLLVGGWFDRSATSFTQSTQFGYLLPDRAVATVDAFADGTQAAGDGYDAQVDLGGRTTTWSVFASDTWTFADGWNATLSGRYNRVRVDNTDHLTPAGEPGSLDGHASYARFNPALGLTWSPTATLNVYAGYSEGNRAPSSIELGCADPQHPCRLPNAMAGDPPLDQVVAKTWEGGLRGKAAPALAWNAGVFRTDNDQDILFVADNQAGFGYFRNFGTTRRQGVEAGLSGRASAVGFGANYTYLDATFRSGEVLNGGANSSNDAPAPGFDGAIVVRPGDRMPLVPRHLFKAHLDWDVTPQIGLAIDMLAAAGFYARGNENNQHQPDGTWYLGPGTTAGYAVWNVGGDWRPLPGLRLFFQVDNVFDRQYATAASLGATGFTASGAFIAQPFATPVIDGARPIVHATFYAPGAPRIGWLGVSYAFDSTR